MKIAWVSFCAAGACACVSRRGLPLTEQPTGEILHLESIASAFVLHMVYSPFNISSEDYSKNTKLYVFILHVPFVHSRKKNTEAYELVLNKNSAVEKTWRNCTYFSYSQSLRFISTAFLTTLNESVIQQCHTQKLPRNLLLAVRQWVVQNTLILQKEKKMHSYFWSKGVFQHFGSSGRPRYSADISTWDV